MPTLLQDLRFALRTLLTRHLSLALIAALGLREIRRPRLGDTMEE